MTLKGLATGIGSMPQKDADAALDLIFKYLPNIPFWPQLPKRDVREGMVAQFAEKFPCIKVTNDGILFDARAVDKELEIFYERIIAGDADYFRIRRDFALGLYSFYERLKKADLKQIDFIKCQLTGPFTFAASINDNKGAALLHDEVLMQAILKGLTMKALWQINLFKEFDKKIILFIDEPYLGCFGSAYTPINREQVIKGLTELANALKSEDVLLGVHCCGNTDWSIFTDVETIDIISFDAFDFSERLILYADNLKGFFKRGGLLCWGIVPTQKFTDKMNKNLLIKKMESGIGALEKKGLERNLLLNNLLVSPSCGLATLDTDKSEKIFRLLQGISSDIKKSQ
jgi:methionine synthase II (cobalamin-independent)